MEVVNRFISIFVILVVGTFHRKTFHRKTFHKNNIIDRTFHRYDISYIGYFIDRIFHR